MYYLLEFRQIYRAYDYYAEREQTFNIDTAWYTRSVCVLMFCFFFNLCLASKRSTQKKTNLFTERVKSKRNSLQWQQTTDPYKCNCTMFYEMSCSDTVSSLTFWIFFGRIISINMIFFSIFFFNSFSFARIIMNTDVRI